MYKTPTSSRKRKASSTLPVLRRTKAMRGSSDPVNSNASGRVSSRMTDLALARTPFKSNRMVTFEYTNELTVMPGATNITTLNVACNDMYDFDRTSGSVFGNKQPLYFDALCSASGPYRNFKVISWETTYTIINVSSTVPITVWGIPPVPATGEFDSAAEADNFPGVKCLYLTGNNGSQSKGTLTLKGHIRDLFPGFTKDVNLVGSYGGSPTSIAFGGLVIKGSDGTTAPSVYIAVRHRAYTELSSVDSIVS